MLNLLTGQWQIVKACNESGRSRHSREGCPSQIEVCGLWKWWKRSGHFWQVLVALDVLRDLSANAAEDCIRKGPIVIFMQLHRGLARHIKFVRSALSSLASIELASRTSIAAQFDGYSSRRCTPRRTACSSAPGALRVKMSIASFPQGSKLPSEMGWFTRRILDFIQKGKAALVVVAEYSVFGHYLETERSHPLQSGSEPPI